MLLLGKAFVFTVVLVGGYDVGHGYPFLIVNRLLGLIEIAQEATKFVAHGACTWWCCPFVGYTRFLRVSSGCLRTGIN